MAEDNKNPISEACMQEVKDALNLGANNARDSFLRFAENGMVNGTACDQNSIRSQLNFNALVAQADKIDKGQGR